MGARLKRAEFLWAVLIFTLLVLSTACAKKAESHAIVSPPPVQNLTAKLEDEVQDLSNGEIRWSTYWRLCWANYDGAREYELQALTSEGLSDELRHQTERCFRLQVAAGHNDKSQGLRNRDLQLAMRSGMLAYRVRAVLGDGRFSEWSKPLNATRPTVDGAQ